ncbi:uncharacterized protein LAESUDRAFT_751541 [Laetiporus sulphureus 93-53]|uniref:Uncharacterized protein n=1 Tax=Laetiporus sulphureus 93-53 TaxID=1314785 RepID=A0A165CY60_9APHY|nr:uncharacterized protein LAESUDRAFT_751541 [Laetiporus sulphureus 93-53]KZT03725.1 hypothetical protein LAESUDRAFT_751541 [Laetiporus sulphureus 93-53]
MSYPSTPNDDQFRDIIEYLRNAERLQLPEYFPASWSSLESMIIPSPITIADVPATRASALERAQDALNSFPPTLQRSRWLEHSSLIEQARAISMRTIRICRGSRLDGSNLQPFSQASDSRAALPSSLELDRIQRQQSMYMFSENIHRRPSASLMSAASRGPQRGPALVATYTGPEARTARPPAWTVLPLVPSWGARNASGCRHAMPLVPSGNVAILPAAVYGVVVPSNRSVAPLAPCVHNVASLLPQTGNVAPRAVAQSSRCSNADDSGDATLMAASSARASLVSTTGCAAPAAHLKDAACTTQESTPAEEDESPPSSPELPLRTIVRSTKVGTDKDKGNVRNLPIASHIDTAQKSPKQLVGQAHSSRLGKVKRVEPIKVYKWQKEGRTPYYCALCHESMSPDCKTTQRHRRSEKHMIRLACRKGRSPTSSSASQMDPDEGTSQDLEPLVCPYCKIEFKSNRDDSLRRHLKLCVAVEERGHEGKRGEC